jgi:hypothetical protein
MAAFPKHHSPSFLGLTSPPPDGLRGCGLGFKPDVGVVIVDKVSAGGFENVTGPINLALSIFVAKSQVS